MRTPLTETISSKPGFGYQSATDEGRKLLIDFQIYWDLAHANQSSSYDPTERTMKALALIILDRFPK